MIHPVVHIAQNNVRLRAFPGLHNLHAKVCAPDSSTDQCSVKNNGFHEPVFGAPERFVLFRF